MTGLFPDEIKITVVTATYKVKESRKVLATLGRRISFELSLINDW